jgi:hypothetical protein
MLVRGKLAVSSEAQYLSGTECVLATVLDKVLRHFPGEICRLPPTGGRKWEGNDSSPTRRQRSDNGIDTEKPSKEGLNHHKWGGKAVTVK